MKHIMLDLETFGTEAGCVVRSIGAVAFERDGSIGEEFYANIDHQDSISRGLTVDPKTADWWAGQSEEAQAVFANNPLPLSQAVITFNSWWKGVGGEYVWAQGANFDPVIWQAAVNAVEGSVPWRYNNIRDTRTVYHIAKFNAALVLRQGTYHNALDDAKHQVRCLHLAFGVTEKTSQESPVAYLKPAPMGKTLS